MTRARSVVASLALGLLLASGCAHQPSPAERVAPPSAAAHRNDRAATDRRLVRLTVRGGLKAYRARRFRDAFAAFDRVVHLRPNDVAARYDRGRTSEALHHWRAAESDLLYVVRRKPLLGSARLGLAVARFHLHRYALAGADFDRASRATHARRPSVVLDAGMSYYRAHAYRLAASRFRAAVAARPRSGRARYWLGMAYAKLGSKRLARREFLLASHSKDRGVRGEARAALRGA
ncbi:MAG: hypothetical protein NVS1B2_05810 [Vulcanimicrobiaceae bacterium]